MINYIKGTISHISSNSLVIENNGIGYNILVSENTISRLEVNNEKIIKIFTYMNVKEDGINLFGFLSTDELEIFNKLISVSGVGPKGALSLLSVMSPDDIILAIIADDSKALLKGQGIGKKTAQRIVLELKDKVDSFSYKSRTGVDFSIIQADNGEYSEVNSEKRDAVDGLVALGFDKSSAVKAVMEVENEELDSAGIIKAALKKLSSK